MPGLRSPWTSLPSVAATSPRPTASQDSPGSSPGLGASRALEASSPADAEAVPEARASASSAIEVVEGTSEMFVSRVPASSPEQAREALRRPRDVPVPR